MMAKQLISLAKSGDSKGLLAAVDHQNIDTRDSAGNTLAMLAFINGHTPLGQSLIARGADILTKNAEGHSVLDQMDELAEAETRKRVIQDIQARTEIGYLDKKFSRISVAASRRAPATISDEPI